MKASLPALLLLALALVASSRAQDKPLDAPADRFVLTKVRLLPKPGQAGLLAGATIKGSSEGPAATAVELARITEAPNGDGWCEVAVLPGKVYRFLKFESAKETGVALGEIEFYSRSGRITGNGFGSAVPGGKQAPTYDKALDGHEAVEGRVRVDRVAQGQVPLHRHRSA